MKMEYDNFQGENVGMNINSGPPFRNPNFGQGYNYHDDHIYGYSERPVSQLAQERLHSQSGLNYDNVGRRYPGPEPPQDYSYFTRDSKQGFSDKTRDYAILITSNIHYFIILAFLVLITVLVILNVSLTFCSSRNLR
jgi:hypothetical protein